MDVVQRFARNEKGRDFVVGDIHGAYDLMLDAMRQCNFNPAVDRLFSVGDLINDRVDGIDRIFVGHTPQWDGVKRYGNIFAIDTGAIYGQLGKKEKGRLTVTAATAQTGLLLAGNKDYSSPLINLIDEDSLTDTPFGKYGTENIKT